MAAHRSAPEAEPECDSDGVGLDCETVLVTNADLDRIDTVIEQVATDSAATPSALPHRASAGVSRSRGRYQDLRRTSRELASWCWSLAVIGLTSRLPRRGLYRADGTA